MYARVKGYDLLYERNWSTDTQRLSNTGSGNGYRTLHALACRDISYRNGGDSSIDRSSGGGFLKMTHENVLIAQKPKAILDAGR